MIADKILFVDKGDLFEVGDVEVKDGLAVISVASIQTTCPCPDCHIISNRLHSYYYRKIRDLPVFDHKVLLRLRSRKFYCDNVQCARSIFAERFTAYFSPYQRMSDRLSSQLLKIALLVGGNGGARLCNTLNISTSSSTLIRKIHNKLFQI